MLRSVGHGRVSVLDGGMSAWVAAGHPTTGEVPAVTETEYPVAPEWTGIVDADAVAQSLEFGGTVVPDATKIELRAIRQQLSKISKNQQEIMSRLNALVNHKKGGSLGAPTKTQRKIPN